MFIARARNIDGQSVSPCGQLSQRTDGRARERARERENEGLRLGSRQALDGLMENVRLMRRRELTNNIIDVDAPRNW